MNVVFLDEAEQELLEAALYYENQVDDLGKKFTGEVYRAIARIIDFPLSNQKLTDNIRRKLLKHYPFAVLYSFDGDTVVVIAVMNLKRKPFYWLTRV